MKPLSQSAFVLLVRVPLCLLILALLVMGTFSKRGYLDFRRMNKRNEEVAEKMAKVDAQRSSIEKQIHAFETDRSEQERVVRQVLGYIKTNETVVEFE